MDYLGRKSAVADRVATGTLLGPWCVKRVRVGAPDRRGRGSAGGGCAVDQPLQKLGNRKVEHHGDVVRVWALDRPEGVGALVEVELRKTTP